MKDATFHAQEIQHAETKRRDKGSEMKFLGARGSLIFILIVYLARFFRWRVM